LPELTPDRLATGLTTYVVLLLSLSVHESAHAWMAHRLGDDTALHEGRVSLNPLVHMDPIGTFLFPLLQIFTGVLLLGWAKPTPYNPANFNRSVTMRQGHMLVAAAGPVSNLILGGLFTVAFVAAFRSGLVDTSDYHHPLARTLFIGISMNLVLALFNLVPIPPLDGSKVASYGLPGPIGERYDRVMGPYGFILLLVLVATGIFGYVLTPIMGWVVGMLISMTQ
jgi:Zn-dependent protease